MLTRVFVDDQPSSPESGAFNRSDGRTCSVDADWCVSVATSVSAS